MRARHRGAHVRCANRLAARIPIVRSRRSLPPLTRESRYSDCVGDEPRKRVVVIGEDDEPIAVLLRDAVNDEGGYQAVVVPDGALLIDTVRQVHADLLILDIMMPGLSGFEVYDRVRDDPGIRHMPVLFISAAADQHAAELKQRGVTAVISKPFDLNEVLAAVRALCGEQPS